MLHPVLHNKTVVISTQLVFKNHHLSAALLTNRIRLFSLAQKPTLHGLLNVTVNFYIVGIQNNSYIHYSQTKTDLPSFT